MKNKNSLQFQEIMQRVAIIIEMNQGKKPYDKDIAYELGLSPTQYANNKKRNKIPYTEIVKFCEKYFITINWVLLGKSSMQLIEREESVYKIRLVESINAAYREGCYDKTLQGVSSDKKNWDISKKALDAEESDEISMFKNIMTKIEDMDGGYYSKEHALYISVDEEYKICYSSDLYGIYVNNLSKGILKELDIKIGLECQKALGIDLTDYGVKLINDKPKLQQEYDEDNDDWALSAF